MVSDVLEITIPKREFFDEKNQEFIYNKSVTLSLEHSLVSISKWEAKWKKPFLGKDQKTNEETIDYIRCMTITQNIKPEVYKNIPGFLIDQITSYINEPMTATWFGEQQSSKKSSEIITSEIIYYWMISQNIPMECQKWHLNRLLTLVQVCNEKNKPPKKVNKKEAMDKRRALNEARKKQLNTKG